VTKFTETGLVDVAFVPAGFDGHILGPKAIRAP
jgi:hypothetical protein